VSAALDESALGVSDVPLGCAGPPRAKQVMRARRPRQAGRGKAPLGQGTQGRIAASSGAGDWSCEPRGRDQGAYAPRAMKGQAKPSWGKSRRPEQTPEASQSGGETEVREDDMSGSAGRFPKADASRAKTTMPSRAKAESGSLFQPGGTGLVNP
jgi:hypothetical protein